MTKKEKQEIESFYKLIKERFSPKFLLIHTIERVNQTSNIPEVGKIVQPTLILRCQGVNLLEIIENEFISRFDKIIQKVTTDKVVELINTIEYQRLNQSKEFFKAKQRKFEQGEPQWYSFQKEIKEIDEIIALFSKWFLENLDDIPATRPYKYFINDDTTGKLIFGTNDFFSIQFKGKTYSLKNNVPCIIKELFFAFKKGEFEQDVQEATLLDKCCPDRVTSSRLKDSFGPKPNLWNVFTQTRKTGTRRLKI